MRVSIKSKNERAADGENLCDRCACYTVIKHADGTTKHRCQGYSIWLQSPVEECSGFVRKDEVGLFQMQQMAWLIEVEKNKIGFLKPGGTDENQKRRVELLREAAELSPYTNGL